MSNYTITTNFGAKDSLPSGNAGKVIKGSEFTTEFTNIQTAIATKADTAGDTFTGAVTFDAAVTLNSMATITGDLTVDTDTLFVDVSADKVGIGTSSPLADLHVSNGTNSDSTPVEFMIGGSANSVRTGSIVKGTTSGAYDLTLQTSNHATQNQPLIIKLSDATEAMRIDSSGNVGIGANSPSEKLHISSSSGAVGAEIESAIDTNAYLRITESGTSGAELKYEGNTNKFHIGTGASGSFTSRMTFLRDSGKVGIGTSSPDAFLDVNSGSIDKVASFESTDATAYISIKDSNTTTAGAHGYGANGNTLSLYSNGVRAIDVNASGNVGIGTTSHSNPLHIKATTNIPALIETTHTDGNSRLRFNTASGTDWSLGGNNNGNFTIYDAVNNNNSFIVEAGAAESTLVIDSNSRVGIGTENPQSKIHIDASTVDEGLLIESTDQFTDIHLKDNGGSSYIRNSNGSLMLEADRANASGSTATVFKTDNTERMRIDSSGKVGIGTDIPDRIVHAEGTPTVFGDSRSVLQLADDTAMAAGVGGGLILTGKALTGQANANTVFGAIQAQKENGTSGNTDSYMTFCTRQNGNNPAERMRISSSGKILIGKTDESVINTVGIEAHPAGLLVATRDDNIPLIANRKTSDGAVAQFRKDNTAVGSISVTSSATAYNTSSDERLKENIADSADAGSKVDAIQIRQFDWIADGSHQDYGVIAQELVTVAPEAVHQPEDAEEMMGVDYSKLVPMLIKEIQSLRSRVAELENA